MIYHRAALFFALVVTPFSPLLAAEEEIRISDFTGNWAGIACLVVFALAYFLAVWEESLSLRNPARQQNLWVDLGSGKAPSV